MDFLDFAKEIELQGMQQYAVLARTVKIKEISNIFEFLSAQEKKHYHLFDSWQRESSSSDLPVETVLGKAINAFEDIARQYLAENFIMPLDYIQAYKLALEFENKSISLYEETLPKIDDKNQQSLLKLIIHQEHAHAQFITALMEFLRHPGEWLENAEWHHLDEF
jgi:rubrerythrin